MSKIIKRKKPFLIAEIGINHNGSINLAKKLIDLAKKCNFNAVKFQKRDPDICIPEYQKEQIRNTPWGDMTYLEYKYKVEFESEEYNLESSTNRYLKFSSCFGGSLYVATCVILSSISSI